MTDVAAQDALTPAASPPREPDPRPASAGSAGQSGAVELAQPPALTEELKARLDKVIYSDVGRGLKSD